MDKARHGDNKAPLARAEIHHSKTLQAPAPRQSVLVFENPIIHSHEQHRGKDCLLNEARSGYGADFFFSFARLDMQDHIFDNAGRHRAQGAIAFDLRRLQLAAQSGKIDDLAVRFRSVRAQRARHGQAMRCGDKVPLLPGQDDKLERQSAKLFIVHSRRFIVRCDVKTAPVPAHQDGRAARGRGNAHPHIHLACRGPGNIFMPAQQDAGEAALRHELNQLLLLDPDLILNGL